MACMCLGLEGSVVKAAALVDLEVGRMVFRDPSTVCMMEFPPVTYPAPSNLAVRKACQCKYIKK